MGLKLLTISESVPLSPLSNALNIIHCGMLYDKRTGFYSFMPNYEIHLMSLVYQQLNLHYQYKG